MVAVKIRFFILNLKNRGRAEKKMKKKKTQRGGNATLNFAISTCRYIYCVYILYNKWHGLKKCNKCATASAHHKDPHRRKDRKEA